MFVVLCGLPGSGKTTLATGLRDRLAERGLPVEVLHSDDFARRTYDRMYERVAAAAGTGSTTLWILDGTFYSRSHRNRFYRLGDVFEVWVRASLETCLARNRARAGSVPAVGVRDIASRFEPPRADTEIDTEALGVEGALDVLESAVIDWLEG